MRLNFSKTLAFSFVATIATLVSCVDSDKDFYDPNFRAENPMGEIVAPEGFDWKLSSTVNLTVNVNDEYNGQYYYVIDVFDENPVLSTEANLVSKGVAKKGQAFSTEIPLPKEVQIIFIRQTSPNGLASIRAYETESGTIDCNFGVSTAPVTRSISTRSFVEIESPDAPDEDDKTIFPKSAPNNSAIFDTNKFQSNKSYQVTAKTTRINLGGSTNINLYIIENVTLTEQPYLTAGSKLYILPGKTLSVPQATDNGQSNCYISVGKEAAFISQGNISLSSNYKLYNLGRLEANNFTSNTGTFFYNKGVVNIAYLLTSGGNILNEGNLSVKDITMNTNGGFYNEGTATITNHLSGQNTGVKILNNGSLTTKDFTLAGGSHSINEKKVTVTGATTLNSTNGSWENEGEWTTENMKISAWNDFSFNKCKLIVNQLLELRETKLINDGGAYVQCKELYMNNTLIELGAKSLFVVTDEAKYGYNTKDRGFKGTGNEKALLKAKKAVAEFPANADMIHYAGKLQVVCDNHPEAYLGWGYRWTMTNNAEWASEAKNPVEIEKSECNEGSTIIPVPPTDPEFPIIVESSNKYTLMFEDQWPLYGDYDMNDIVMEIKGLKYELNSENKTKQVTFTLTLQAVGAAKPIAAAVMLDKVRSTVVSGIEYDGKNIIKPMAFNTTGAGVEAGQEYAVIPLFDDAHHLMGKRNRDFINTLSGSSNNLKESELPAIEITILLSQPVPESNFNINNMNFFIITDKASLRKEVHMAGSRPSQLATTQYFGNNDDGSVGDKHYVSKENLAWGIIVPQQFKWPLEYNNIKNAYKGFERWVTSGGVENKQWWNDKDANGTFQNNKN